MKQLAIVTTNPDKQAQAKAVFAGSDFVLEFIDLEMPEIQAYTCEEVAEASAELAFTKMRKPLVVTDAGYFISALNGFPGPFLKYVNTMLSSEDILSIMKGKTNRGINLVESIAYKDERHTPKIFTSALHGTLATEVRGEGRLFDKLFVPEGFTQTAGELGHEKMGEIYLDRFTHWRSLRRHLEEEANA